MCPFLCGIFSLRAACSLPALQIPLVATSLPVIIRLVSCIRLHYIRKWQLLVTNTCHVHVIRLNHRVIQCLIVVVINFLPLYRVSFFADADRDSLTRVDSDLLSVQIIVNVDNDESLIGQELNFTISVEIGTSEIWISDTPVQIIAAGVNDTTEQAYTSVSIQVQTCLPVSPSFIVWARTSVNLPTKDWSLFYLPHWVKAPSSPVYYLLSALFTSYSVSALFSNVSTEV